MPVAELRDRGDALRKALDWSGALDVYLHAAHAVETPDADLCLKLARCVNGQSNGALAAI
jgi:hypothetical protein